VFIWRHVVVEVAPRQISILLNTDHNSLIIIIMIIICIIYLEKFANVGLQRLRSTAVQVWHHHLPRGSEVVIKRCNIRSTCSSVIARGLTSSMRLLGTWKTLYLISLISISLPTFPSGPGDNRSVLNLKSNGSKHSFVCLDRRRVLF